jgi:uncharacterized protein (DUF1501 family)
MLDSPTSGSSRRLVDLNGFFGLHPSLSPLYPFYRRGELGFVHACGSGDVTLSHFAASNTVERGLFQEQGDSTGWLARYLDALPPSVDSPVKAISIGSLLPASLAGASCAMAIQNVSDLLVRNPFGGDGLTVNSILRKMYSGTDIVSEAGRQTSALIDVLKKMPDDARGHGPLYRNDGLGRSLHQVAQLYRCDTGLAVACIDHSGYDTHVVQGGAEGILASALSELSKGICEFVADLGSAQWRRTKIVVMSEFGRRVRENDGGGTDHGHGSVMMVLGGSGVNGNAVHGVWPGLHESGIDENGNLRVTTDYRNVLFEVASSQIGTVAAKPIFPDLISKSVGILYA